MMPDLRPHFRRAITAQVADQSKRRGKLALARDVLDRAAGLNA
jgi:hypothetical protein